MATNFLATAGTNGFLTSAAVTAFSSGTTTINSIANAAFAVSTGVFTQTNTANGLMGYTGLTVGSSFGPTAGGNITGWWLMSPDGGATYESTVMVRPPDWMISLSTSTSSGAGTESGGNAYRMSSLIQMPWSTFKVLIQNNSGVTIGSSGNSLTFMSVAVQY